MGALRGDSAANISYFGIILSYWPHNLYSFFSANKILNLKAKHMWPHFKICGHKHFGAECALFPEDNSVAESS